jgi:hypothetical protein
MRAQGALLPRGRERDHVEVRQPAVVAGGDARAAIRDGRVRRVGVGSEEVGT